jgi:hypothetical protein
MSVVIGEAEQGRSSSEGRMEYGEVGATQSSNTSPTHVLHAEKTTTPAARDHCNDC